MASAAVRSSASIAGSSAGAVSRTSSGFSRVLFSASSTVSVFLPNRCCSVSSLNLPVEIMRLTSCAICTWSAPLNLCSACAVGRRLSSTMLPSDFLVSAPTLISDKTSLRRVGSPSISPCFCIRLYASCVAAAGSVNASSSPCGTFTSPPLVSAKPELIHCFMSATACGILLRMSSEFMSPVCCSSLSAMRLSNEPSTSGVCAFSREASASFAPATPLDTRAPSELLKLLNPSLTRLTIWSFFAASDKSFQASAVLGPLRYFIAALCSGAGVSSSVV